MPAFAPAHIIKYLSGLNWQDAEKNYHRRSDIVNLQKIGIDLYSKGSSFWHYRPTIGTAGTIETTISPATGI